MTELYQIHRLLRGKRAEALVLAGSISDQDESLLQRFHCAMCEPGIEYNDDELASILYGTGHDATHKAYQKLKYKFKFILLNLLLVMDNLQPDYSSSVAAQKTIFREMSIAKILAMQRSTSDIAAKTFERVYKRAKQFEVTASSEEAARSLSLIYGGIKRNRSKRKKYKELYQSHRNENDNRQYLVDVYTEMLAMYRQKSNKKIIEFVVPRLERIQAIIDNYDLVYIQYLGHLILQTYYDLSGRSDLLLSNAETAIRKIKDRPGAQQQTLHPFYLGRAQTLAGQNQFELAISEVNTVIAQLNPGERGYYKACETAFTISMSTSHFQEAKQILNNLNRNKMRKSIDRGAYQQWSIYRAYVAYLEEHPGLNAIQKDRGASSFRIGKLKNETAAIVHQKDNLNLQVYILEYLFLALQGKYSKMIDRTEPFQKYIQRYLSPKNNHRAYYFCKAITEVVRADFHAVKLTNYTRKYVQKFQFTGQPDTPSFLASEEILSFNLLWNLFRSSLNGAEYLGD